MTPSVSPISAQALNLLPMIALPIASQSNKGWLVRWRGDGQVYENRTGIAWTRLADGTSAPPTAISNDVPFTGNPSDLDTAEELADAIQDLRAWKNNLDADEDGEADKVDETFHRFIITVSDQRVFTLPRPAKQPLIAQVEFEGLIYRYGVGNFSIDTDNVTFRWLNEVALEPGYSLTITYR